MHSGQLITNDLVTNALVILSNIKGADPFLITNQFTINDNYWITSLVAPIKIKSLYLASPSHALARTNRLINIYSFYDILSSAFEFDSAAIACVI